MQSIRNKRSLAAIIGAAAAAGALVVVPKWEGTELKTYKDIAGILTYCTGATENAMWGKTYTVDECKAQLDYDLARHAEGMMACIKVPLTDGQKIAFTSVTYNIGISAFCGSSMARRANAGDLAGSCAALSMWNKAGGREVLGLTRRRADERVICEGRKP